LALEVETPWRQAYCAAGYPPADPRDEHCQPAVDASTAQNEGWPAPGLDDTDLPALQCTTLHRSNSHSSGVRSIADEQFYRERQFPIDPKGFCKWGAKPDIKEFK